VNILITGAAGFIGAHVANALCRTGHSVTGIDSFNNYYDPALKIDRLKYLNKVKEITRVSESYVQSDEFTNYRFKIMDICNERAVKDLFRHGDFDFVAHFAAQAGVRYSLENPDAYVNTNVSGFLNILEGCRHFGVKKLFFASSSSVYGDCINIPWSEDSETDRPLSIYAATKKSNELMAYSYSHLFRFHVAGLRLFTVYGPWGRPDMAPYIFTKSIYEAKRIRLFNNGNMYRDFTYIDDLVESVIRLMNSNHLNEYSVNPYYSIFNIGSRNPVSICDFLRSIEKHTGLTALIENHPIQPGDALTTFADTERLLLATGYAPSTKIDDGVRSFIQWFKEYYGYSVSRRSGIVWSENEKN
jgi:UDP-glucuronate 4-epimerase